MPVLLGSLVALVALLAWATLYVVQGSRRTGNGPAADATWLGVSFLAPLPLVALLSLLLCHLAAFLCVGSWPAPPTSQLLGLPRQVGFDPKQLGPATDLTWMLLIGALLSLPVVPLAGLVTRRARDQRLLALWALGAAALFLALRFDPTASVDWFLD